MRPVVEVVSAVPVAEFVTLNCVAVNPEARTVWFARLNAVVTVNPEIVTTVPAVNPCATEVV
jgi:hypothetical protein